MIRAHTRSPASGIGVKLRRFATVTTLAALAAGCSATPDWANPIEWYRGASDAIFDDADSESVAANQTEGQAATPGADEPFPNLSSVPERPAASTAAEREALSNSLAADRENARYSEETIARQTD